MEERLTDPAVLILGGGINGASVARELILNGVSVWLVDQGDLASGATSASSRLIHGGVRYLEYGEFRLVREALAERERLLVNAPQFVQPLQFALPVTRRRGGERAALWRLLGFPARYGGRRGLWLLASGLWLYDRLAASSRLPRHATRRVTEAGFPQVDREQFRWLCCYWDAQMWHPERYTLALLRDATEVAAKQGLEFRIVTHAQVVRQEARFAVRPAASDAGPVHEPSMVCMPAVVVNASGAWGDRTLHSLEMPGPKLLGGTKGSHALTSQAALRTALGGIAVYAESQDGRMVFIIPYRDRVLVGTTDLPWDGDPREAVPTEAELSYLLELVNEIFPQVQLQRSDLDSAYCGVRPLPASDARDPGSVTRDHRVVTREGQPPTLTLIGGKLTTSRQLGELVANQVLRKLGRERTTSTAQRVVPGGEAYPRTAADWQRICEQVSQATGWSLATVQQVDELLGTRAEGLLRELANSAASASDRQLVAGTHFPRSFVAWVIRHEWVQQLDDLIERRLMLSLAGPVRPETREELAALLAARR